MSAADPPLWFSLLLVFGIAPAVAVGAHMALHAPLGGLPRDEGHAPVLRRVLRDGRGRPSRRRSRCSPCWRCYRPRACRTPPSAVSAAASASCSPGRSAGR